MKHDKIMNLRDHIPGGKKWPEWLINLGERWLGFHVLNVAHDRIETDWDEGSKENFFKLACQYIPLSYEVEGLENIPKEGPCVVVANHPRGMSEGLIFGDIGMRVRDDVRIIVNDFLHCVRGMRPYQITVDVYGGEKAKRANMLGMKQILQWLREGHCVLVFPSGSAASYSKQDGRIIDDPWQTNIASIIRKTNATVVPLFFFGRSSRLFQFVTVTAKHLRPNILPREINRDCRMHHKAKVGEPLSPTLFPMLKDDSSLSDFLRLNTTLLSYPNATTSSKQVPPRKMQPIEPQEDPDILQREIDALPPDALYYSNKRTGMNVYAVEANQIPRILHEIGVLREITFRAVSEGSGLPCDCDEYDLHYVHLVMWDSNKKAVAGAYRMGRTDQILQEKGKDGIYNSLFFDFKQPFLDFVSQGIEMGRAFIAAAYQRHPASLDTLWMGIGRFLVRHPQYRYLYGTVSVSSDYSPVSRALIHSYLLSNQMLPELAPHITAKSPPQDMRLRSEDERLLPTALEDPKLLGTLVSRLESDNKSIPVLLKQYLRLGGKMVSFNVDNNFGGTLDCMVIVDLQSASSRIVSRYMETSE